MKGGTTKWVPEIDGWKPAWGGEAQPLIYRQRMLLWMWNSALAKWGWFDYTLNRLLTEEEEEKYIGGVYVYPVNVRHGEVNADINL